MQVFVNYVTRFENTLPGQPERARASKAWALRLGLHLTLGSCARKALVVGAEARARCFQIAFFKIMLRNLKTPCQAILHTSDAPMSGANDLLTSTGMYRNRNGTVHPCRSHCGNEAARGGTPLVRSALPARNIALQGVQIAKLYFLAQLKTPCNAI